MRLRLPTPLHGWRVFAGEVGIVVLGVLLALIAQQVAEAIDWANRVRDAEASMSKELGEDDGAQAHARIAIGRCLNNALARVEEGLRAERDRGIAFRPAALTAPDFRTWDDDAWRAAVTSNATSHMETKRMYDWSAPYSVISDMDRAAMREFEDWAPLREIQSVPAHPTEAERERLLGALANARQDNRLIAFLSWNLVRFSHSVGVTTPDWRRRQEIELEAPALNGCTLRK